MMKQRYPYKAMNAEVMSDNIHIYGFIFELQTIIGTRSLSEVIWDGSIWSRHGVKQYINWWFDNCYQKNPIQLREVNEFPYNDT